MHGRDHPPRPEPRWRLTAAAVTWGVLALGSLAGGAVFGVRAWHDHTQEVHAERGLPFEKNDGIPKHTQLAYMAADFQRPAIAHQANVAFGLEQGVKDNRNNAEVFGVLGAFLVVISGVAAHNEQC